MIRTVTHEEVTAEELGRRGHPRLEVERRGLRGGERGAVHPDHPQPALLHPPEQPGGPALRGDRGSAGPDGPGAPHPGARQREQALRHEGADPAGRSTTRNFFEVSPLYGKNMVVGFGRFGGRSVGIVANQPSHRAGVLDIDASKKGGALRALLRRLQPPDHHLRRRAGLPAGRRPGARRHHQARREAALRLLRGDRAARHHHHPQGLWRRLRRHEQQAHARRREPRLPDRGAGGDGAGRGGEHRVPQRAQGRPRSGQPARRAGGRPTARTSRTRTRPPSWATSTR